MVEFFYRPFLSYYCVVYFCDSFCHYYLPGSVCFLFFWSINMFLLIRSIDSFISAVSFYICSMYWFCCSIRFYRIDIMSGGRCLVFLPCPPVSTSLYVVSPGVLVLCSTDVVDWISDEVMLTWVSPDTAVPQSLLSSTFFLFLPTSISV